MIDLVLPHVEAPSAELGNLRHFVDGGLLGRVRSYVHHLHTFTLVEVDEPDFRNVRSLPLLEQLADLRSEEHTSELQSRSDLVCRLLLEKKKETGGVRAGLLSTRMSRYCLPP